MANIYLISFRRYNSCKVFFATSAKIRLHWNEPLPANLKKKLINWLYEVRKIKNQDIPRSHSSKWSEVVLLKVYTMHTFTDISNETAYALAVYWRISINEHDKISGSLAVAKRSVSTLNFTSIPRLEIQTTLLSVRLVQHVTEEYEYKPSRRVARWWYLVGCIAKLTNGKT